MSSLSLAILQRVCTPYRLELFRRLSARPELRVRVLVGEDLPDSKVRNAPDFGALDVVRLPTRWLGLRGRVLPWHRGLAPALRAFGPDVILSEGDSHLLGYLTALRVRGSSPRPAVVHWGLGGLPGDDHDARIVNRLKQPVQARADAFLCYSSYGADVLARIGHPRDKIVVAVNVSDTDRHRAAADSVTESRSEARRALGLPDRFTVLAIGALDANKRVEVLIDAVSGLEGVTVLVVGGGPELERLRARAEGIEAVHFSGRVPPADVARYYRASDLLALPGRGGMVISEAMAHSLPVVVHQADGTEYDLVRDGETGVRLQEGGAGAFRAAIERLAADPEATARMGAAGRRLIETQINLDAMVDRVLEVCQLALARRTATPSS